MGLFNKKKKEEEKRMNSLELPELPELPDFDNGPKRDLTKSQFKLPNIPPSSIGNKFSQNTIKEAVTGKKEDEEVFDADEFDSLDEEDYENEEQMMQKPLQKPFREEIPERRELQQIRRSQRPEPFFIRLDKFEEALKIFEKTKGKITEIERMLRDIKGLKIKEEEELEHWEKEMQSIKNQIEKVDQEIFSKIE